MNTQPKALRLATIFQTSGWTPTQQEFLEAAAELRRLYQSEKEAWRYADELKQDRNKIHKIAKMVYAVMSDIYQVCDGANHQRKDMHPYGSDCPIQKRFDDAWDALHQALYEEKEQA